MGFPPPTLLPSQQARQGQCSRERGAGHLEGQGGGVGGRGGHDEFRYELRELDSWGLLGELRVCGNRHRYPGTNRVPPGVETSWGKSVRREKGGSPVCFCGRGGSKAGGRVGDGTAGGEENRERKARLPRVPSSQSSEEERCPQGVDAKCGRCGLVQPVLPGQPSHS